MSFKKKKINTYNPHNKGVLFSYLLGVIGISIIFFVGVSSLAYFSKINFTGLQTLGNIYNRSPTNVGTGTSNTTEKEKISEQNNKHKINILVVGRGGGKHDAPDLTDTIILLSLNTKSNRVSMLSIPRDLYIEYDGGKKGKINQLYESNYSKTQSVVSAMKVLQEKIQEITSEEIDYFVNLDFKGFIDLVDTVGGIEINIPETFVDNQYPDENLGYTTFILRKGLWTLDGDVALKYARSRHSTSDFDRSLRQQVIINALKDKMMSLKYLSNPKKIKALYSTFQKDIQTDIPLTKLISLALKLKNIEKNDIISSNLNDSCFFKKEDCQKGGFLYYPRKDLFGGMSLLLPDGSDNINISEYEILTQYADIVFNKTEILSKQIPISIFNATKTSGLASDLAYDLRRYGFNIPKNGALGNTENKTGEKSIILYNGISKDDLTLIELGRKTGLDTREVEKAQISNDSDVKIEIFLADDYGIQNGGI